MSPSPEPTPPPSPSPQPSKDELLKLYAEDLQKDFPTLKLDHLSLGDRIKTLRALREATPKPPTPPSEEPKPEGTPPVQPPAPISMQLKSFLDRQHDNSDPMQVARASRAKAYTLELFSDK